MIKSMRFVDYAVLPTENGMSHPTASLRVPGPVSETLPRSAGHGYEPLIDRIRRGLGQANARRIGPQHAAVLATMLEMDDPAPEVRALYKALIDSGRGMVTARLYRVLRVLEEAGVVRRSWVAHGARVRGAYCAVDRLQDAQAGGGPGCAACAPLRRSHPEQAH